MRSYVNSLLQKDCYADLHPLFSRSNNPEKEISESMAAFHHMVSVMGMEEMNQSFNFHIGDGAYCRTGALFSFLSKSFNVSIDPIIKMDFMWKWRDKVDVRRLDALRNSFDKIDLFDDFFFHFKNDVGKLFNINPKGIPFCNIICVHAHVNLKEVIKHFPRWRYLYTNPCCKPESQTFDLLTMESQGIRCLLYGQDERILSDKREVVIYENLRCGA